MYTRFSPQNVAVCPGDQLSECPDGNTCCEQNSGQYGCCPQENGVCCSDGAHCCPSGYACNPDATCSKPQDVVCPGQKIYCHDNTTCCLGSKGDIICCPGLNAVCCDDYIHCCSTGHTCNATGYCFNCNGDLAVPFRVVALQPKMDHSAGYKIPAYKIYPLFKASVKEAVYKKTPRSPK